MSAATIATSAASARAARVSAKAPASRGVAFRASAGVRGIAAPRSAVLRKRPARAVLSVRASDDSNAAPPAPPPGPPGRRSRSEG
jgi:type IV secretory pathway TrbL component